MYSHSIPFAPAVAMSSAKPISYSADSLPKLAHAQSGSQMKYTLETHDGRMSMTEMPTSLSSTR